MKDNPSITDVMKLIREMPHLDEQTRKWVRMIALLAWGAGLDDGWVEGKASVTAGLKSKWDPIELDRVLSDCYDKGLRGVQVVAALRKIGMSKHEAEARLSGPFRTRAKHKRPSRE